MEAMRARMSTQMVPLGKKNKGIIQDNLGQTSFKKAFEPPPSKKRSKSMSDSSDDELDLLSQPSPPPTSSLDSFQNNANRKSTFSFKSPPKRNKPKPRIVQSKSKGSSKLKTSPISPPFQKSDTPLEIPPSNQLAFHDSQSYDEVPSSPLEELNRNTDKMKQPKNPKGKRKLEIQDFPMDVEAIKSSLSSKHRRENGLASFPVSPPTKVKASCKSKETELAPFPMEIPHKKYSSASGHNSTLVKSSTLSDDKLRSFPMTLPGIAGTTVVEDFVMPEFTVQPDSSSEKNVDPSRLCPYCDELLPSDPSPVLQGLMTKAKRNSRKDPRPGNPLGLMAPLIFFAEVCERHRLEMNYLPLAISRGWPRNINFITIPDRIRAFKKSLDALIIAPEISSFWKELKTDMAAIGRKKLASVTGQFATFEKSQPGYYGEQGSIIIQQTLYSLFPNGSISDDAVEPLTVEQFLSQVLLPETAILLIMEDMKLSSRQKALDILEESKKYGIAMFPERAQGNAVAEVGERLVRERALSRRKYLREIGDTEEDVANEIRNEETRQGYKGKKKASVSSTLDTLTRSSNRQRQCELTKSVPKGYPQTPRPKPKPKAKLRDYFNMSDIRDDETPRPATKAVIKLHENAPSISTSTKSRTEVSSSDDSVGLPWKSNLRGQKID